MSSAESVEAAMARLLAGLGSGRRHGPGRRPAVVVVDLQRHFVDADPGASPTVAATAELLDHARRTGIPVFLVRIGFDDLADVDPAWAARFDLSPLLRGAPGTELDPRIGPRDGDVVVDKRHASAFAGTDLAARLSEADVDTVLLCGMTTSGCVRATAVDAASLGLRVEIVRQCVADPRPLSGPVALADLADRYADVISIGEAVSLVRAGHLG
ncbi:cysteine hydrolase family protein [Amycolatopsis eburnea]|uniref:Cysteine hydrolase n=1 Tax=Amycolatopsis eburnea TaxID=2267691 RepID=A0A427T168_9PSEU|nr:isochorismatase family cysteine hydrolase [Amycolatopsis eburnea]RSD11718.1 cysteine hydrolase [Amycolatopsis eburnea]